MNQSNSNISLAAIGKRVLAIVINLLAAIFVGAFLLVLVYCIPISPIQKHVSESIDILQNEDSTYGYAPRVSTSYPDHVTDALMLCISMCPRTGSALYDAMSNQWVGIEGYNHIDSLILAFSENKYDELTLYPYHRYWHGYLIWLKPLLSIMSLSEIRIFAMWFQLALLFFALYELSKKDKRLSIAFFLSYMFLNPFTSAMSTQYACIYCITLILTIVLVKYDLFSSEKCWLLFLWGGIATAYFDFLTYPIVALGIPLIVYIALTAEKGLVQNLKDIIENSVLFTVGYGGMWAGKWILASIFTGDNTIAGAIAQVGLRMGGEEKSHKMTIPYVFNQVLMHLNNKPMKIFVLLFVLCVILAVISRKFTINITSKVVPVLILSIYPFIWYVLVRNHSATHSRLEQREMAVAIMGLVLAVLLCLKPSLNSKKTK